MGMYDELRCLVPVDGRDLSGEVFQTKDLACMLDSYEIRPDGLWHQEYDVEDHSDPTKEGIAGLLGAMTRVNQRWFRVDEFTDAVWFYGGSEAYVALFRNGDLMSIDRRDRDEA